MTNTDILVAETISKDVLYSVPCLQTYTLEDGSQLVVEVARVDPDKLIMALGDAHTVIKYIDATLSVVDGCLAIAAFIFPPAAPVLLALAGIGSFIQFGLGLFDHPPDPVTEKLKVLEATIHAVEKKMNEKFNELKLFITESEFTVDVISEVAVLSKLMRNCMKYQNKQSVATFQDAYERKSPLTLAYIMISMLEQKATNPLVMAMDAEGIKTKATFKKWENTFKSVLGQLLFIEAFACGLLKNESAYDQERIIERSKELYDAIDAWRIAYGENNEAYWEEVRKFTEQCLNQHGNLTHSKEADMIKEKIETYLTNDAFYIIILDWKSQPPYYWVHNFVGEDQYIFNFGRHGEIVFVYRSKFANTAPLKQLEQMRLDAQEYEQYHHRGNPEMPRKLKERKFVNAGFSMLLGEVNEVIRSANCPRREYGPGWWTVDWDFGDVIKQKLVLGFH